VGKDWRRLVDTWETWAARDGQFAILSSPEVRGWDRERFMAHTWEADHALSLAGKAGHRPRGEALDFGCGVGRLTQRLADSFDHVVGIDISPTMIEQARTLNRHAERCDYICGTLDELPDDRFDFILSVYVIQHIPHNLQAATLGNLLRVLKPDGILVATIHSGWPGWRGWLQRYAPRRLLNWRWRQKFPDMPRIEMNPISAGEVARILAPGGRIVDRKDDWYVIGREPASSDGAAPQS
jgi:2-polyprenyl-3-methyl-5-hydroxy-6-metoxy-1,4-benzoquinol methylase